MSKNHINILCTQHGKAFGLYVINSHYMNNNKCSHIDEKASRAISIFGGILHLINWALTILLKTSNPRSWVTHLYLFKAIPIIPKMQRVPMEKEWRR